MHKSCTCSNWTKHELRRESGHKFYPQPISYLQLMMAGKRKLRFLHWGVNGNINHTRIGPMIRSSWCPTQNGFHILFVSFCLIVWALFVFLFFCLLDGWENLRVVEWGTWSKQTVWKPFFGFFFFGEFWDRVSLCIIAKWLLTPPVYLDGLLLQTVK